MIIIKGNIVDVDFDDNAAAANDDDEKLTPSVRLAIAGVFSKDAFKVPGSAGRAGREP